MLKFEGVFQDGSRAGLLKTCRCIYHEGPHWLALLHWQNREEARNIQSQAMMSIGPDGMPMVKVRIQEFTRARGLFELYSLEEVLVTGTPDPEVQAWAERRGDVIVLPETESLHQCQIYHCGDMSLVRPCCVSFATARAEVAANVALTSSHPSFKLWQDFWNTLTSAEMLLCPALRDRRDGGFFLHREKPEPPF